ncbi:MAG: hypothetical protein ABIH67_01025 [Candidatus Uhrbacteria bacterium]
MPKEGRRGGETPPDAIRETNREFNPSFQEGVIIAPSPSRYDNPVMNIDLNRYSVTGEMAASIPDSVDIQERYPLVAFAHQWGILELNIESLDIPDQWKATGKQAQEMQREKKEVFSMLDSEFGGDATDKEETKFVGDLSDDLQEAWRFNFQAYMKENCPGVISALAETAVQIYEDPKNKDNWGGEIVNKFSSQEWKHVARQAKLAEGE